jgi:hypothetical protein
MTSRKRCALPRCSCETIGRRTQLKPQSRHVLRLSSSDRSAQPSRVHRVPSPPMGLVLVACARNAVGVFVLALVQGVLADLSWFYLRSLPLLTFLLLFAFRIAQATLKPPVERNLTAF